MSKDYQVLITGTADYFSHIAVLIKNFIAFHRHPTTFIIGHNVKDPNDPAFLEITEKFKDYPHIQIKFHYVDPQLFIDWGMPPEIAKEPIMLRLALPTFPYSGKVLYLDVDTVISAPLDELFTDENILQGKSIAACIDIMDFTDRFHRKSPYEIYKFPSEFFKYPFGQKGSIYFNSGVLLIDLDKIRVSPDKNKNLWQYHTPEIFKDGSFYCLDQTFLNIVHFNDKTILSSKYNFYTFLLYEVRYSLEVAGWKNYEQALKDGKVEPPVYPSILHFITLTDTKQWNSFLPEYKALYDFYKNQSVEEIISEDVSYYQNMMINYYDNYGYTPCLVDFGRLDKYLDGTSIKEVSRSVEIYRKAWNTSPLFLCTTYYRLRGLRKFLHKSRLSFKNKIEKSVQRSTDSFVPLKELAIKSKK